MRTPIVPRAFSLIEVIVAVAISSIVAIAAVSVFATLNRQLTRFTLESVANDNAKTIIDYLVSDLQSVGGGNVRPFMAIQVENSCGARGGLPACSGSGRNWDRLTVAQAMPGVPACSISAIAGAGPRTLTLASPCDCLDPSQHDWAAFPQAMLTNGDLYAQMFVSGVNFGSCTATVNAGPMSTHDSAFSNMNTQLLTNGAGFMTPITVTTVFLDAATNSLKAHTNLDDEGTAVQFDSGEVAVLANNVFDFQVQLGYDVALNGTVVDSLTNTDEWLYNVGGEIEPPSGTNGLNGALRSDLRMAAVGVVVGVNIRDTTLTGSAQIVNGSPISLAGFHLRGAMGRATLRNTFFFQ